MNRKKGLLTTTIILYAILVTFTCLSCGGTYSDENFEYLRKAKIPIYLPELEPTTSTQDYKVAFNFGIAACDALACIYNEDQMALPRYMGMVYDYAKKLGISQTVLRKLGGITAAMDQGDWKQVLQLSANFGNLVFDDFKKRDNKNEALLAMVALNLEHIYITAKSVDNRFSPESAILLRNVDFVKYMEAISVSLQTNKEVKAIMAALPKINQIINRPENYPYTQADAKELISICEPLRKTLLSD